jgi:hypothetical protein
MQFSKRRENANIYKQRGVSHDRQIRSNKGTIIIPKTSASMISSQTQEPFATKCIIQ